MADAVVVSATMMDGGEPEPSWGKGKEGVGTVGNEHLARSSVDFNRAQKSRLLGADGM